MGARVIPDQSGGQMRWLITKTGQRNHVLNVHIAPWVATTGAYVGTYSNGDTDVYDSASIVFAQFQRLFDTSTTLQMQGFFPVVSGTVSPVSNVDPALSPETISGAGISGTANVLGGQITWSYHDDAGNVSKLVFLDPAGNNFNPLSRVSIVPVVSPGNGLVQLANIMTGFVSAGVFHTTPYMSHAGGIVTTPITAVSTYNRRLRRDYGEI